jgi:hypothetical protein
MLKFKQTGGGNCSLCNSQNTNKSTCPLNPAAKHPNSGKHPLAKKSSNTKNYKKLNVDGVHDIIFSINYRRSNDDASEPNPTPAQLEKYISESAIIPEHVAHMGMYFDVVSDVTYIGKRRFHFKCTSELSNPEIANAFLKANLVDDEYEARPGDGSFVYPSKDAKQELGLLYFDEVYVDGKIHKN